jgi:mRNA interferase MazF
MTNFAELRKIYSHHWMMKKMATTKPRRGEVWLVDLGMVAKIRPCLVVSIPANDENDRVLTTLIPHTTSTRGSRFEIAIASRFLKTGAFDVQNVITIPTIKMIRMLGKLTPDEMLEIEAGLKAWLGLTN